MKVKAKIEKFNRVNVQAIPCDVKTRKALKKGNSVDVDSKKIAEKIIETSKAHLYTCAPYENTWLKNTVMMTASDYLALE